MKTLLVNPPANEVIDPFAGQSVRPGKTWVPLGIAYVGAVLRDAGHDVTVRDMHSYSWAELEAELKATDPDIVGISCFTMWKAGALRTARLAKQVNPEVKVVMGGPHATFFPEQVLTIAPVDAVVLGEGEQTFLELVRAYEQRSDLSAIKGLVFKRDGAFLNTGARAVCKDLDRLPFPLYDHVDLDEYKSPEIFPAFLPMTGTHIITSRGCPFGCRYCSVSAFWGRGWRPRSPKNVIDELEWLYKDYGVLHVYFSDDLFSFKKDRVIEICQEMLRRNIEIVWMAETRVDCVSKEMLSWMRRAGCYRVYYGVESGSSRILKAINKGVTPDQVRKAFRMTHEAGIQPCAFLMVGNPGEDESTIDETIALVNEIQPATTPIIGLTQILPATHLYQMSKEKGLIDDDFWLSDQQAPFYTGDHSVNDLIALQFRLTKGVAPDLYNTLNAMGLGENFLRMRRLMSGDFQGPPPRRG